jgi:enterochelin esterase-like enzyme
MAAEVIRVGRAGMPVTNAMRQIALLVLAALMLPVAARGAAEVPLETVRFEHTYNTTVGQSVFVVGSIPELGAGDVRRSLKLVPIGPTPDGLLWRLDVAIPQGTAFTYRFVLRDDAVAAYRDPANGSYLTAATAAATQTPSPAARDRIVYSVIGDGATEISFLELPGSLDRPLLAVPGRADVRVATSFARPNGPGLDFRIFSTVFDTPRHTILHRAGALFDYVPAALATSGTIVEFALPTSLIVATRTINGVTGRGIRVYLPRGYAQHVDRCYPVLYMHDGQNVFLPGGPFGCWRAEAVADDLIRRGRIRELIIVAVDNSPNRLPEYNPDWPGGAVMNHAYNQFLVTELKPYVDANFRTFADRVNTGVMGSSFGGVASISVALEFPGVFGRIGPMSTSFSYTVLDDRLAAGDLPAADRVYLDTGDTGDGGELTIQVRDELLETGRVLGDNLHFQIGFNQQHNEAAWNARLPVALEALFPISEGVANIALPLPLRGDADGDGCVSLTDLTLLLSAFGACDPSATFNAAVDLDENGCINLGDLSLLLAAFGDCN